MKQSRGTSLLKSAVSTAVGFGVAMIANALVLPLFGYTPSLKENFLITCIYTVISVARGYALERIFEALGWRTRMSAFAMAVLAERQRQKDVEGWSDLHDDEHSAGELSRAGACYALHLDMYVTHGDLALSRHVPVFWPWSKDWWKPAGFRRDLVKASALIIAEGERFDRQRKSSRRSFPVTDSSVTQSGVAVVEPTQTFETVEAGGHAPAIQASRK